MKLIRSLRMQRRQQQLVFCEVTLYALSEQEFVVHLRQWRSGQEGRESARTPSPVSLSQAENVFQQALLERQSQGFSLLDAPLNSFSNAPAAQASANTAPSTPGTPTTPTTPHPAQQILLDRIHAKSWQRLTETQRTRTIWRIGELRIGVVVPVLVGLLGQGSSMQDYCLAYAIGRAGDAGAAIAMYELQKRSASDATKRMARQAWFALIDSAARQHYAEQLLADWPANVRSLWTAQNETALLELNCAEWRFLSFADWLEQLDLFALGQLPSSPMARRLLLGNLSQIKVQVGVFRALRHLYKAAEMRGDAQLFGVLHQLFENSPALFRGADEVMWLDRKYISYRKEVVRTNSRVAYSRHTRDYFLRRSWRTLRRLGEAASTDYVPMAVGVLLAIDDAHLRPRTLPEPQAKYDQYSHWQLFNHIARSKGAWRSVRWAQDWVRMGEIKPKQRAEAFPELWDAQPQALLQLLLHSRCAGVHEFAACALAHNSAFCAQLPLEILCELLRSDYAATIQLALTQCQQRYQESVLPRELVLGLLMAKLATAQQFALQAMSRHAQHYASDQFLIANLLCAFDMHARAQGRLLCMASLSLPNNDAGVGLLAQLLNWLEDCRDWEDSTELAATVLDLQEVMLNILTHATAVAPYAQLLRLLAPNQGHNHVAPLIAQCLLQHVDKADLVPSALLEQLLRATDPQLQGAGVVLFGALPDSMLYAQAALVASFCTSSFAQARRSIQPAIARLLYLPSPSADEFATQLMPALLDCLFRSETAEGVHDDVLACLRGPMQNQVMHLEADTVWRLLTARSKSAIALGASVLSQRAPSEFSSEFSIKQWAQLGRNEQADVRAWACRAYRENVPQIRASMEEALRLFDSRWDDSRAFAFDFFREQCLAEDWTPALLVGLCDHLDVEVQAFGRETLSRYFELAEVVFYLIRLAQHPSHTMQLFVSNWLESAASGELAQLEKLEPYFLSVLSQVNRGRLVKSRVQHFLQQQATQSPALAEFVARLFSRLVVTVAIGDKAQYIAGLHAIHRQYPQLANLPAFTEANFAVLEVAQ